MGTTATTTTVQVPPTLTVSLDEKTVPMMVSALWIDVDIAGTVSRTTLVVTFENPHDRDLEGELTFPLPAGAALCGYGLDIDGEIVDASLVEKQKARVVFEEEVRKGIDPGLLEQVRGNQFRTRIWPLPARGRRSVKVEYVSALETRNGSSVYELPLRFEPPQRDVSVEQVQQFAMWAALFDTSTASRLPTRSTFANMWAALFDTSTASSADAPLERFRLRVTVAKGKATPQVWDTEAFKFEDCGDAWVAEMRRGESLPEKVRIGLPGLTEDSVAVERFANDEFYFRIDARVVGPESSRVEALTKVALVWDASLSRAIADKNRDLELLRSLMKRLEAVDVDVFVLRNDIEEPRSFSVVAGECEAMLEMLSDLPYDGGTSLGGLKLCDRTYDAYLVFSDGISSLDEEPLNPTEIPVYVVSSDAAANRPVLRHMAEQSGGAYLDLTVVPVEQASQEIFAEKLSLLGVQYEKGAIADVYPSSRRLLKDGVVGVSGRLLKDDAEITLRFGCGNEETERRSFNVSRRVTTSTGLIGRLWAQQKADELSLLADRYSAELLDLGRRFHIVTPNSSLLVLETLNQHLEHEIAPAPSRGEMCKEYDQRISRRCVEKDKHRKSKLDHVISLWQERVAWWDRSFDLSQPAAKENGDEALAGGSAAAEWFYTHQAQQQGPVTEADIQRLISQGVLSSLDSVWKDGMADWQPVSSVFPQHAQPGMVQPVDDDFLLTPLEDALTDDSESSSQVIALDDPDSRFDPASATVSRSPVSMDPSVLRPSDPPPSPSIAESEGLGGYDGIEELDAGAPGSEPPQTAASIAVKPWDPKTPYLEKLKSVSEDESYDMYLKQREAYGRSPSFYLDCADYLFKIGQNHLALRVLTNVAELDLESPQLLRILAYKLETEGELALASRILEQVLAMRPEEPQSYRDLALVLDQQGEFRRAAELLWAVVTGEWDDRFPEIETVALMELNRVLERARRDGQADLPQELGIDLRLVKLLDQDLRVALSWDADLTDVDLWVTEPNEEKCFYSNNRTRIGGRISPDFTQGYGPEEYVVRRGMPGAYQIQAIYFGSSQQTLTGPATLLATVFTNFGRPNEDRRILTVRVTEVKDVIDVGEVKLHEKGNSTPP